MDVLIMYDIESELFDDKNSVVKDAMKELGYHDHFKYPDPNDKDKKITYYLPNTTLWRKDTTPLTAKNDLQRVAKENDAKVERLLATVFADGWKAIPGKPYKKSK
jgi:hypothetical protein